MTKPVFRWLAGILALFSFMTATAARADDIYGPAAFAAAAKKTTTSDARPNIYNFRTTQFPHWRAALANAANGGPPAVIAVLGDSLKMGVGAGTGTGATAGAFPKNVPSVMATMLSRALVTSGGTNFAVSTDSMFGWMGLATGTPQVDLNLYNPNISVSTDWGLGSESLGGKMWSSNTGSGAITLTPKVAVDTITVWYARLSGQGVFKIYDSNGQIGSNVDTNGGSAFLSVTVTRTASTLPISIARVSGGALNIAGIEAYNSTSTNIRMLNVSTSGTTAGNKATATQPWSPLNTMASVPASLWIIDLATNDQRHCDTDAPTLSSYLQAIVAKAKLTADVLLIWHHPDNAPICPQYTKPFRDATLAVARANDVTMYDMQEAFGTYAAMSSLYYDSVHGLPKLYWYQATLLDAAILINAVDYKDLPRLPANDNDEEDRRAAA